MLSDLTNFHQVLCTLSKISTCRKALRTNVSGFLIPEHVSDEEEHIYESLHYYEITPRGSSLANSTHEYMLPEETYKKICPVSQNHELKAASLLEKRYYAIKELIDTEKQYVDVLSATVEKFMANLRQYMTPQDISITFFKIKNLFDLHLEFLCELLKINNTNPFIKVSNIFLNWSHKFLIYGPYCENITKAQRKIEELCRDEIFLQILTKCEMEYKRLHLVDILKFPMNRFLQYRLLLERIIKYTPHDHEEHNDLHKAMEAMLQLNDYINEMKGDSDRLEEAEKLQGVIQEWNYDPTLCKLNTLGRLIKDDLVKIRFGDGGVLRNRNIFILDRFILICKRLNQFGPNQFAYQGMINIAEYFVRDDGLTYQFYLEKKDHQMKYMIYARSTELKEQIIRAITDARAYIDFRAFYHFNHHRYQLTTFNWPERCATCSKYLNGKIYQGYKCDICNLVVHKNCISNSENCGIPRDVKEKLWYVGEMDRKTATEKLSCRESGTFLIRIRPENDGVNVYSLTLKNGKSVYYFKIFCINERPRKYYLIKNNIFQNLIQLVHHYQMYSLGVHFKGVPDDAKLLWPYRQLRAIVIKKYVATDILELSLSEGQSIKIITRDGYCKGFWKGRTESNEIGYFPMDVVKVEGEVNFEQMEDDYCF